MADGHEGLMGRGGRRGEEKRKGTRWISDMIDLPKAIVIVIANQ